MKTMKPNPTHRNPLKRAGLMITAGGLMLLSQSCSVHKHVAYFKDISDESRNTVVATMTTSYTEPKIQTKDILQVSIQTLDPQSNVFSPGAGGAFAGQP